MPRVGDKRSKRLADTPEQFSGQRAGEPAGLTTSEYVRMAIHRKLWQDALTESRRVAVPRARAKGVFTDEDVFALIS
jgi:hypothetical protein